MGESSASETIGPGFTPVVTWLRFLSAIAVPNKYVQESACQKKKQENLNKSRHSTVAVCSFLSFCSNWSTILAVAQESHYHWPRPQTFQSPIPHFHEQLSLSRIRKNPSDHRQVGGRLLLNWETSAPQPSHHRWRGGAPALHPPRCTALATGTGLIFFLRGESKTRFQEETKSSCLGA